MPRSRKRAQEPTLDDNVNGCIEIDSNVSQQVIAAAKSILGHEGGVKFVTIPKRATVLSSRQDDLASALQVLSLLVAKKRSVWQKKVAAASIGGKLLLLYLSQIKKAPKHMAYHWQNSATYFGNTMCSTKKSTKEEEFLSRSSTLGPSLQSFYHQFLELMSPESMTCDQLIDHILRLDPFVTNAIGGGLGDQQATVDMAIKRNDIRDAVGPFLSRPGGNNFDLPDSHFTPMSWAAFPRGLAQFDLVFQCFCVDGAWMLAQSPKSGHWSWEQQAPVSLQVVNQRFKKARSWKNILSEVSKCKHRPPSSHLSLKPAPSDEQPEEGTTQFILPRPRKRQKAKKGGTRVAALQNSATRNANHEPQILEEGGSEASTVTTTINNSSNDESASAMNAASDSPFTWKPLGKAEVHKFFRPFLIVRTKDSFATPQQFPGNVTCLVNDNRDEIE